MSEQDCKRCRHSMKMEVDNVKRYYCKRYPPTAQVVIVPRRHGNVLQGEQIVPVEETRSMFPNVVPEWTCGEWAPKIEALS